MISEEQPRPSAPDGPSGMFRDRGRFQTTRWTVILQAGAGPAHFPHAMEQFARAYWYPVYSFIRRRGSPHEAAEDLTQGFFAAMLEKNWLEGVERRETRFSTLLLNILHHYLISGHRHETRQKRGGGQRALSLDMAAAEQWFGAEPRTDESPERIFERKFALSVLGSALETMKEELHGAGRGKLFDALSPYLSREPVKGDYDTAAAALGISTNAVAAAVLRLRREYRQHVREEVAAGLSDPARVDEELRHLAAAIAE